MGLFQLLIIAAAVGVPIFLSLRGKSQTKVIMPTLDELSSKLKDIDLTALQRWVDTLEGITYDQRLHLLSQVLRLVKEMMNPSPPVPPPTIAP